MQHPLQSNLWVIYVKWWFSLYLSSRALVLQNGSTPHNTPIILSYKQTKFHYLMLWSLDIKTRQFDLIVFFMANLCQLRYHDILTKVRFFDNFSGDCFSIGGNLVCDHEQQSCNRNLFYYSL